MQDINKGLEFMNTESACKTHNLFYQKKDLLHQFYTHRSRANTIIISNAIYKRYLFTMSNIFSPYLRHINETRKKRANLPNKRDYYK